MAEIIIQKDHDAASVAAARLLLDRVAAHPAMEFHLGLSGGSTPRHLFELLASEPFRSQMPWGDLRFWFVDERVVPLESPLSNYRQAEELLLGPLEIPQAHICRIPVQCTEPQSALQAATAYHALLEQQFGPLPGARGLDLVLLGMGADGHTASIFPGHGIAEEPHCMEAVMNVPPAQHAWALPVEYPNADPPVHRVTMSLAALNASACAVLLVTGAVKAEALAEALRTAGTESPLPAGRIMAQETVWIIDQNALER